MCCCLAVCPCQGADFGSGARKEIEQKLRSGMTLDEIEWRLKNPGKEPSKSQLAQEQRQRQEQKEQQRAQVKEAPKPAAPPPPPKVEVGQSMVKAKRDPLSMIKVRTIAEIAWRTCNMQMHM